MPKPHRRQLKDGSVRWVVRFRDGKTNASERFVTREHADQFCGLVTAVGGARARAIINEHESDAVMTHTLGEVIDRWYEWKSATKPDGTPLRVGTPYTLTRYEQIIRLHIKPALGHLPVNLVSEPDVQEWIDDLAGRRSRKLVGDAHSLLHAVYTWAGAKSRGLTVIDPCMETELPTKAKRLPRGLKPAEWRTLHAAAVAVDKDAADLLAFMVYTGWRWSEVVAVRAMDVDVLGADEVYVSVGRVLRRVDGNRFVFVDDDAKSQMSIRRVRLGGTAAALVRRRLEGLAPTDLLLRTRKGGAWRYSSFHSDYWTYSVLSQDGPKTRRRILQRAEDLGLERAKDVKLHWLRHTHAALMLMSGEPMAAVQKRLGHEDIRTTVGTYGSMVSDVSVAGLAAFDAMLSEPVGELEPV